MSDETFESVWDAIEDTPEEAANMKLRSALMMALGDHIRTNGWTQQQAELDGLFSDLSRPTPDGGLPGTDTLAQLRRTHAVQGRHLL